MRALAATCAALVGCAYEPGSFRYMMEPFAGQLASIQCLDLAIERRPGIGDGRTIIAHTFGNRCDHPVTVDLLNVVISARATSGRELTMTAYDPLRELHVLRIDGRLVGHEAIAYSSEETPDRICVDAGS